MIMSLLKPVNAVPICFMTVAKIVAGGNSIYYHNHIYLAMYAGSVG